MVGRGELFRRSSSSLCGERGRGEYLTGRQWLGIDIRTVYIGGEALQLRVMRLECGQARLSDAGAQEDKA